MYKAGTGTFLYSKKSSKQKKIECAQRQLPEYAVAMAAALKNRKATIPGRGLAGRGRGGRGRGGSRPDPYGFNLFD